mmetsp:Transcript_23009/g.65835  ORF Transcript_23009/g.65835 Transcript_23009/m.65835 type:complete len:307 (-) Transcript_23009:733-1653(-)
MRFRDRIQKPPTVMEGGAAVRFIAEGCSTRLGEEVFVCGSVPELGNLNALPLGCRHLPTTAKKLQCVDWGPQGGRWESDRISIANIPGRNKPVEYKYVICDRSNPPKILRWETEFGQLGQHRAIAVEPGQITTQHDNWGVVQPIRTTFEPLTGHKRGGDRKRRLSQPDEETEANKKGRFGGHVAVGPVDTSMEGVSADVVVDSMNNAEGGVDEGVSALESALEESAQPSDELQLNGSVGVGDPAQMQHPSSLPPLDAKTSEQLASVAEEADQKTTDELQQVDSSVGVSVGGDEKVQQQSAPPTLAL